MLNYVQLNHRNDVQLNNRNDVQRGLKMLTIHEREKFDKLNSEISGSYQNYISYLSPSGLAPGVKNYQTMLKMRDDSLMSIINRRYYLDTITEKN